MNLKDDRVIKLIYEINNCELNEIISQYPQEEIDQYNEILFVIDQVDYAMELYTINELYKQAKEIKKRTNNFTTIPLDINTLQCVYSEREIEESKAILEDYRNLKLLKKKLLKIL